MATHSNQYANRQFEYGYCNVNTRAEVEEYRLKLSTSGISHRNVLQDVRIIR